MKKSIAVSMGALSLLLLTSCDPPMPESLKVELAEREVQCGQDLVSTWAFAEAVEMVDFWSSSMAIACSDSMAMALSEDPLTSSLLISDESLAPCEAYASVPVAADSAAFAFSLMDSYELNLSPKLIVEIYSGQISDWSDARISELNPNAILPDLPINVSRSGISGAIEAMEAWLSFELGEDVSLGIEPESTLEVDALYELSEGDLRLSTFSALQVAGVTFANMVLDESDPASSIVILESRAVQTAVGQTKVAGEAPFLSFQYDPNIEPQPLPGQLEVIAPWGAVFPTKMFLCGSDSLDVRYVARYVLRLDAQGSIANGVFSPLNEDVRVAAAAVVATGLPEVVVSEEVQP